MCVYKLIDICKIHVYIFMIIIVIVVVITTYDYQCVYIYIDQASSNHNGLCVSPLSFPGFGTWPVP